MQSEREREREEIRVLHAGHASRRVTMDRNGSARRKGTQRRFARRKRVALPEGSTRDQVTTISRRLCSLPRGGKLVSSLRNLIASRRKRNALFSCLRDGVHARESALNRLRNVARRRRCVSEEPDRAGWRWRSRWDREGEIPVLDRQRGRFRERNAILHLAFSGIETEKEMSESARATLLHCTRRENPSRAERDYRPAIHRNVPRRFDREDFLSVCF